MPFHKYREWAQWGKVNTRILKQVYQARIKRKMPGYPATESFTINKRMAFKREDKGHGTKKLKVYGAQELLDELAGKSRPSDLPTFEHPAFTQPKLEVCMS